MTIRPKKIIASGVDNFSSGDQDKSVWSSVWLTGAPGGPVPVSCSTALVQCDSDPVHKVGLVKIGVFFQVGVEELVQCAQRPDLDPTQRLWGELERRPQATTDHPASGTSSCGLGVTSSTLTNGCGVWDVA